MTGKLCKQYFISFYPFHTLYSAPETICCREGKTAKMSNVFSLEILGHNSVTAFSRQLLFR